ncbi:NADH-quinone oxidoreductase subunit L [compost metagenome]
MQQSVLVSLVPLFPLISGIIVGLMALFTAHSAKGPNKALVGTIAVLGPALSAVAAIQLFMGLADNPQGFVHTAWTWFATGNLSVPIAFHADRLSGVMIMIVTLIGTLIHLYSVAYMWEDRGFARFFSYLNLFTFSMLVLVLGKNIPLMFLGWEGVGAMSYLLIGFWYKDTDKAVAANKAFIVNRVGDFAFLIGMFVLFYYMGSKGVWTFDFQTLRTHAELITPVMATVIGLLLFVGATGKSAQIPLHVWLADAMAGPTPVSALIHAATMVTAGVYMIARTSFLYTLSPTANLVIMIIGAATALMAATIAITQSNIKKVLAYSTVSQLGYMFMGVGAGAYAAGVFHLFTHAFFKALLFLGAGAVIHAMHHHEEMQHYGGLRKKIPFTAAIMLIGCLAIAGVPPFAGFFSKDLILASLWETGYWPLYLVGLLTSGITAFYMFRMLFLTFWGKPRDHHTYEHAHEGPWQMNLPLGLLALGTCFVGFFGMPGVWGGSAFANWLAPAFPEPHHHELAGDALIAFQSTEYGLMGLAVAAGGLGILLAWVRYGSHATPRFAFPHNPLWNAASHKWFWDEFYQNVVVRPLVGFSRWGLWRVVENAFIDGFVNGLPRLYLGVAQLFRYVQTGVVRLYAYAILAGVIGILAYVVFRFQLLRF